MQLNGIRYQRQAQHPKGAIFIPLPKAAWKLSGGSCSCGKCDGLGAYDTLAIDPSQADPNRQITWMVHYPELQATLPQHVVTANG